MHRFFIMRTSFILEKKVMILCHDGINLKTSVKCEKYKLEFSHAYFFQRTSLRTSLTMSNGNVVVEEMESRS